MKKLFWYTETRAAREGRKDARKNFPHPTDEVTGYLGGLEQATQRSLHDEAQAWSKHDERLTMAIDAGNAHATNEGVKLVEHLKAWKDRGIPAAFPSWLHWLVLVMVMGGEFAINELALRAYEDMPLLNILMTLGLGAVIASCAHFVGRTLKRPVRTSIDKALIGLSLPIVFAISLGVAHARSAYMAKVRTAPTPSVNRNAIQMVANKSEKPSENTTGMWMFVAFQVGAFFAATLTAYASLDPLDYQRKKYTKAVKQADQAYTAREKSWRQARENADKWIARARAIEAYYIGENVKHRADSVRQGEIKRVMPGLPEEFFEFPASPERFEEVDEATIEREDSLSLAATAEGA